MDSIYSAVSYICGFLPHIKYVSPLIGILIMISIGIDLNLH